MTTQTPAAPAPVAEKPIIIERPNVLRQKVGGSLSASLANVASQVVKQQMSSEFDNWMADLIGQLGGAFNDLRGQPITKDTREGLYKAALEIKSQGETFGYPLATRVAHSLCRLLIHLKEGAAPVALVQAHIQTLQALVRDGVKDAHNRMGSALAQELESQSQAFIQTQ